MRMIGTRGVLLFIVGILCLSKLCESVTCGGNCPSNSCSHCFCGSSQNYVAIDKYCLMSKKWNVNCCKCVFTRLTGGNAHYMWDTDEKYGLIGMMKIRYPLHSETCGLGSGKDLCDASVNLRCAEKIYEKEGWNHVWWSD
jgi:hypothetical protein